MGWRWRLALAGPRLRAALRSELLAELARPAELGEPWPEAVAESAREHPSAAVRSALSEIQPRLEEGRPLSESLEGLEDFVGRETPAVLRAAERSDSVEEALALLERGALEEEDAGGRLRQAWIAPAITSMIALLVLGVLVSATLPTFRDAAAQGNAWVLRAAPSWGVGALTWVQIWLALVVIAAILPRVLSRLPSGERIVDHLPWWGGLRRAARSAHVAGALSKLLGAGVPLHESVRLAADILPVGDSRRELHGAAHLLSDGASAREVFGAGGGSLSTVLRAVLAAGDGDETLPRSLARLAAFERAELERRATRAELASSLFALTMAALFAGYVTLLGWLSYYQTLDVMSH